MGIKRRVIKLIKKKPVLIAQLVVASGKSYPTIQRWLDNNDESLTTAACLKVICESLELSQDEVLEIVKQ
jgi:hypothetical protein